MIMSFLVMLKQRGLVGKLSEMCVRTSSLHHGVSKTQSQSKAEAACENETLAARRFAREIDTNAGFHE